MANTAATNALRQSAPVILQDQEKEQKHRGGVQKNVAKVMAACLWPVELAIQYVRDRGQRVPVGPMTVSEGPADPVQSQPTRHHRIFIYVNRIVVVDKSVAQGLPKDQPRDPN